MEKAAPGVPMGRLSLFGEACRGDQVALPLSSKTVSGITISACGVPVSLNHGILRDAMVNASAGVAGSVKFSDSLTHLVIGKRLPLCSYERQ